jgi:hypothetical protein
MGLNVTLNHISGIYRYIVIVLLLDESKEPRIKQIVEIGIKLLGSKPVPYAPKTSTLLTELKEEISTRSTCRQHLHSWYPNGFAIVLIFLYNLYQEQVNFQLENDEVRFVQDEHVELDFYSASSLKQQSAYRYIAPLGHILHSWYPNGFAIVLIFLYNLYITVQSLNPSVA